MRDTTVKYGALVLISAMVIGVLWQGGFLTKTEAAAFQAQNGQAPPANTCGNGVCEASESASTCAADCTSAMTLVCPSDGDSKYEVSVRDILNESGYNRLAVTVKKISPEGNLIDEDTSSSTGSTLMKVPCKKAAYTLIAYDDDNSGLDIYPAEVVINAYTAENGALAGGRIPVTINALLQGNLSLTVWDTSGGAVTDNTVAVAAGETNPYIRIMVQSSEDDKAVNAVVLLLNYTVSDVKKWEIEGSSPAGLTVKECNNQIPSYYSGDGGFEKAFCLFQNGQPLILDSDARTAAPPRAYFDVTLYAHGDTDPSSNTTWRAIDRMRYWEADGVTWAEGGVPAAEDAVNNNLGLIAANEPLAFMNLT